VEWILDDNDIVLLARVKPGHFSASWDVTDFLGESDEWGQLRAPEVFLTIRNYDHELNAERAIVAAKKKEENKRRAADKRKEKRQAKLVEAAAFRAAEQDGVESEVEDERHHDGLEVLLDKEHVDFQSVTHIPATCLLTLHDSSPVSSRVSSLVIASQPHTPCTTVTPIARRRPHPPPSPMAKAKTPPPPSKRQRTRLHDTTNTYELHSQRRH
jgi:hypothetical protein